MDRNISNNGGTVSQNNVSSEPVANTPSEQPSGPNLGAVRKSGQMEVLQALSRVAGVDGGGHQRIEATSFNLSRHRAAASRATPFPPAAQPRPTRKAGV